MATKQQNFIYEYQSDDGFIYEIEGPETMTEEDMASVVSSYKPQETQKADAPAQGSDPSSVPATPFEKTDGTVTQPTLAWKNNPEISSAAEDLWRSGERDASVFNQKLSEQFPDFGGFNLTPGDMAGARKRDAYYKARGLQNPGNFITTQSTGVEDPEAPEGVVDTAWTAGKRSLANMANSATGLAAAASDIVGADETADSLLEKYVEDQAKISFNYPRPVERVTDVDSLGDAALYGADILGELAPQVTSGVVSGALGRAAGGAIGKAAAGAIAGTAANSIGQQTGSIYGDTFAATGEKAPVSSIIAGIASGGLESILPLRALNRLGVADNVVKRSILTRMAQEGGKDFAVEGATEAAQTFIEQLPESVITGESPFTDEMLSDMVESFVRGGVGGGAIGAATSATQRNSPDLSEDTGRISVPSEWAGSVKLKDGTSRPPRKGSKQYNEGLSQTTSQVDNYVSDLTKDWTNAPSIKAYDSFKTIDGLEDDALGGYNSETGEVAINTEAVLKEARLMKISPEAVTSSIVFHEGLGHYGLAQKFGDELDSVLANFIEYGDDNFKYAVQNWLDKKPNYYKDGGNTDLLAAEEILAEWSEQGYIPRSFYDKAANLIKSWGRNLGMDLQYSEREIKTILSMAHSAVINGKGSDVAGNGFRLMTGWHGSKADFDEFDDSFVGTGEGAQIFGHGAAYIAGTEGRGKHYRDAYSDSSRTWNGVEMSTWQMRDEARRGKPEELSEDVVDAAFSTKTETNVPTITGETIWEYYYRPDTEAKWNDVPKETKDELNSAAEYIEKNYDYKSKGKLYEVELPDVAFWLDWEVPIKDTDMQSLLQEAGLEINDYDNWNYIERQFYDIRNKYDTYNFRLGNLEDLISNEQKNPGPDAKNLESYEAEADLLFQRLQEIAPEYNRKKKEYETNFHEDMTGEDVYGRLVTMKGSPKAASEFLSKAGFTGNRYLAENIRARKERTGNESNEAFNWVVFKPKDAKIVNKYMKSKARLDPKDLTADELFEAENAVDLLRIMSDSYDKVTLNYQEISDEAAARGISPSGVLRRKDTKPGDMVRKLYMYDIAMEKLNNKLAGLHAKMNNGTWRPQDKANYLKTIAQFQDLTAKVFGEQSEAGRALNAIKNMQYTKNKIEGIQGVLSGLQNAYKSDEDFFKFAKEVQDGLENSASSAKNSKIRDNVVSTLSIPRTIMSSSDFSAPFRQGLFLISRPQFWKSIPAMAKFAMSNESFDSLMRGVENDPVYSKAAEAGISFSNLDGNLSQREEAFTSKVVGKLPVIAGSNRAYSGYLNKLRFDVFKSIYEKMDTPDNPVTARELKALGNYINNATGRGDLGSLNKASAELATAFFSPRLIASRVRLLGGAATGFATLPPRVRAEAQRDLAGFVGAALMVATLAVANGAEVEKDPRSSDFLKLRWGNTRYDILGGFGQYITLAARMGAFTSDRVYEGVTGDELMDHYKTVGTGDTKRYEGGQFGRSAGGALADFFRNKTSPNTSFLLDFLFDENAVGEEFDLGDAIASRAMPMFVQDVLENADEYGAVEGTAKALPGVIGIGVQTFTPSNIDPNAEVKFSGKFKRSELEDMNNEYIQVKDGEVKFKGEARKMAEENMNFYIKEWMKEEMAKPEWKTMTDKEKAKIISEVRADAKNDAKLDVLEELGL